MPRKLLQYYTLHVEKAENSGKNWSESIGDNNVKNMSTLTLTFHFFVILKSLKSYHLVAFIQESERILL